MMNLIKKTASLLLCGVLIAPTVYAEDEKKGKTAFNKLMEAANIMRGRILLNIYRLNI